MSDISQVPLVIVLDEIAVPSLAASWQVPSRIFSVPLQAWGPLRNDFEFLNQLQRNVRTGMRHG